jgi:hypothetical protein
LSCLKGFGDVSTLLCFQERGWVEVRRKCLIFPDSILNHEAMGTTVIEETFMVDS